MSKRKPTPQKFVVKQPHEVFDLVQKSRSKKGRVEILKEHGDFTVKSILQFAFSGDTLSFDLPEGLPPFTQDPSPDGVQVTPPQNVFKRMKQLLKVPAGVNVRGVPVDRIRKETIFIQMLETLSEGDVKVLVATKEKNLDEVWPNLTKEIVTTAFPKLRLFP